MPKTRLTLVAMLAVAVLAAGCGGDDATDEPDDEAASEVTASGAGQPATTAVSESTEPLEQADAAPKPEPVPVRVRLGDRFPWCADIQRLADEQQQAQVAHHAAEAALLEARAALAAASDELDRAEARTALEAAEERYEDLRWELRRANSHAARVVSPVNRSGGEATEEIALDRAKDAYSTAADPAVVWAAGLPRDFRPRTPPSATQEEPEADSDPEPLTLEDALADIDNLQTLIRDAQDVFISARRDIDGLVVSLHDAEKPEDVMALQSAAAQPQAMLHELTDALGSIESRARLNEWVVAYEAHAEFNAAISDDEYYASRTTISEATRALMVSRNEALQSAGEVHATSSRFLDEMEALIDGFLLADTAGMTAFWESLSESCQP